MVSKASRIAVDSRSRGALRFCPAAVSQERKGQEGAGGHSSRSKGNEGSPFLYRGTSLLLGAVFALLAASNGFANGGAGGLPRRPQVNTQECSVQQPQPDNCSNSELNCSTLDLERVTTLIIKNNDTLENLNLSNLEKLTTLIIKSNNNLTQLEVPGLAYLTDIRIENNDNLGNIKKYKKPEPINSLESLIDNWESFNDKPLESLTDTLTDNWKSLQSFFNDKPTFIIKHNKCLGNLTLENLNHLRELRIVGNKNLTEITLTSTSKLAEGEVSANSAATVPDFASAEATATGKPP